MVNTPSSTPPCPEFMWCQRSDRVYVTIKVADCAGANVTVTAEGLLTFTGTGHGMCGQKAYRLEVELCAPVVPKECCWFVSGPSVRVRLQKEKVGPYWSGLLAGKRKMAQLKVDWASWLDEDEETERSAAPNGFDVDTMKLQLCDSDNDPLYRNPDRFDSSTSDMEGEEMNSIQIDEGESTGKDIQAKFHALDYEKGVVAKAKAARFELRKKTREAVLFAKQRERDIGYGRPVRELTAEEEELLAGAEGLWAKLKEEKKKEKAFWLSKWWHQKWPEKRKIDLAEPLARQAAVDAISEELGDGPTLEGEDGAADTVVARAALERTAFLRARTAALDKFNEWEMPKITSNSAEEWQQVKQEEEGRKYCARDIGARVAREEVAKALGEAPQAEALPHSLQLKKFAEEEKLLREEAAAAAAAAEAAAAPSSTPEVS